MDEFGTSMVKEEILLNGLIVRFQRKQIKNINLRIKSSGEVSLSAPHKTSMKDILRFLQSKEVWIKTNRLRIQNCIKNKRLQLITGEYIPFLGAKYQLVVHESLQKEHIELIHQDIHLFIREHHSQAAKERLLRKWYFLQMQKHISLLIGKWQDIMGVSIHKVSIKLMRSIWGSCQAIKKHITLNLRLIEKPLECLEYVIVHELVHLFERGHNQRFYNLMTKYLPNWKEMKKLLKNFQ